MKLALKLKHLGPGPHPDGTPQSVHDPHRPGGKLTYYMKKKLAAQAVDPTAETAHKLRTSKITGTEGNKSSGAFTSYVGEVEGVGKAIIKLDVETNDSGFRGYSGLTSREVAAFEVSHLLGIGNVPITVSRDMTMEGNSVKVSVQQWVNGASSGYKTPIKNTNDIMDVAILDAVLGNLDRHDGNWVVKDGRMIAIDHGLAFPSSSIFIPSSYVNSTVRHVEGAAPHGSSSFVFSSKHLRQLSVKLSNAYKSGQLRQVLMNSGLNDSAIESAMKRTQSMLDDWYKISEVFKTDGRRLTATGAAPKPKKSSSSDVLNPKLEKVPSKKRVISIHPVSKPASSAGEAFRTTGGRNIEDLSIHSLLRRASKLRRRVEGTS